MSLCVLEIKNFQWWFLPGGEVGGTAPEERYQNAQVAQPRASRAHPLKNTIRNPTSVLNASRKRTSRFNKQITPVLGVSDSPYGVLRILYSASVFGVRFLEEPIHPQKSRKQTRALCAVRGCLSRLRSPRLQTPQLRRKSLEPKYYIWSDDFMLFLLNRMVFSYLFSGAWMIG